MGDKRVVLYLSKVSYLREDHYILKDVDLKVYEGERWVILGVNGSGKTTLLKIISGYIWPTEGVVEVLGYKFGETNLRELRRNIGFVSPDLINLIPENDSLLDVILSGKFASFGLYDNPDEEDYKFAIKLIDFIDAKRIKDLEFRKLSMGEKQRCLIGRALMANPSLLLLDEPFQGLDLPGREKLLNLIEKLGTQREDITLILTTHHLEEIPTCFTHALLIDDGKIFMKGLIQNVLNSDNISRLFNCNIKVKELNGRFFAFSK
ncbi:MAG: ABC transporter ATP-binding protein [Candidatus Odinarchaeia archaeon]